MGKKAQTIELSTNLKLCTIPRVMYCGAIARVIGFECAPLYITTYILTYIVQNTENQTLSNIKKPKIGLNDY